MDTANETDVTVNLSQIPDIVLVADEDGAKNVSNVSLVGKICSNKCMSKNVVFMILRTVWFTKEAIKVKKLENNVFLFSFKNETDRNRIWRRRPWSVNGSHLILREWSPDLALSNINFNLSSFWVQVHGLPMRFMIKENDVRIGGLFSQVLQCESATRTNIVGLKYIKMQVEIDVTKPIPSGFQHVLGNRGCWIQYRYERLAEFCYNCGLIGHAKSSCK